MTFWHGMCRRTVCITFRVHRVYLFLLRVRVGYPLNPAVTWQCRLMSTPSEQVYTTPLQAKASIPQSMQQSAASAGQRVLPQAAKPKASRLPPRLPSLRGVALPMETALRGTAVPGEAAKLGVPADLAQTLALACLPLTAAVQPKPDLPPPSPNTVK